MSGTDFWQRVASDRQTAANIERARADKAEALLRAIADCDLSAVRADYNGALLRAIADAHDWLAVQS